MTRASLRTKCLVNRPALLMAGNNTQHERLLTISFLWARNWNGWDRRTLPRLTYSISWSSSARCYGVRQRSLPFVLIFGCLCGVLLLLCEALVPVLLLAREAWVPVLLLAREAWVPVLLLEREAWVPVLSLAREALVPVLLLAREAWVPVI